MALSKNWPPGQGIADDATPGFYIQFCVQPSSAIQENYSTILNVGYLEGGEARVRLSTSLPGMQPPYSAGRFPGWPSSCCIECHCRRRPPTTMSVVPKLQVASTE